MRQSTAMLPVFLAIAFVFYRGSAGASDSSAASSTAPSGTIFKAGFAERDISPDIGMEQPGGYGKAFHRSFHDPCMVRAAVFDDGRTRVALVGIDALVIPGHVVAAARDSIHEKTGIEPQAIMIAASHSHSAGPVGMVQPGEYDHASPLVQELAYKKTSCADAGYLARVEKAIVEAVTDADAQRTEARCAAGLGHEETVSFNRRFRMKNGLSFTHPGQGNPDIVEPAGPIDPAVGVVGAWDSKTNTLLGCIVNFSCHCTTGPGGISADYVHYLVEAVRGVMGNDAVVVFLNGASGDVTQVDNRSPYAVRQFGEPTAHRVGGRVGAEAAKVLLSSYDSAGMLAPLAFRTRLLPIKRRRPSAEHLAHALELVSNNQPPAGAAATDWMFAKETVLLDAKLKEAPEAQVEVQAIQIGPAVFLSCPAEYFCQYGLDIKAASKFPYPMVVSLANNSVGYVPTEEAFGPHGGGYETRLTSYSNLETTAGKQIADALISLSKGLTPGPVPQAPPVKPATTSWSYGSVPPQAN